jgi:hypothetical protein
MEGSRTLTLMVLVAVMTLAVTACGSGTTTAGDTTEPTTMETTPSTVLEEARVFFPCQPSTNEAMAAAFRGQLVLDDKALRAPHPIKPRRGCWHARW